MIFLLKLRSSNYPSVACALALINREFSIVSVKEILNLPNKSLLIIPGVGSIASISEEFFSQVDHSSIIKSISNNEIKIFGICLGFQFLFSKSLEGPNCQCLGLLPGTIEPVHQPLRPFVGWSALSRSSNTRFPSKYDDLLLRREFYFTHSYGLRLDPTQSSLAYEYTPEHSLSPFVGAFFTPRYYGTQFHPEKSGKNGLTLLRSLTRI